MVKNILKIIIGAIIAYPMGIVVSHLEQSWHGKSTCIALLVIDILVTGLLIFAEIRKHNKGDKE